MKGTGMRQEGTDIMTMNPAKRILLMFSVMLIALTAYFALTISESYADTTAYTVKITSTTVNVRSGAGTSYTIVGKLHYGDNIRVYGTVVNGSLKWYKIIYNKKTAYVASTYTKVLSKTITYSPVRSGKSLKNTNIRTGPSTSKPSIGVLKAGQTTNLYSIYTSYSGAKYSKWHRVSYNGQVGYVIVDFVKMLPTVEVYSSPKMGLSTIDTVYRTLPYISASVAGTLEKNSLVTATAMVTTYTGSSKNKWYRTTFEGKTAYVYIGEVKIISTDDATAFEAYLTAQGFPESYKTYLRGLHQEHPKWIFKAQLTGLDWSSVLAKEQKIGVSLLSSSTSEAWKSFESGAYDFINNAYVNYDGSWNAADGRVVAYYLDPRNFLNASDIYQFMDHRFDAESQNTSMIRTIAAGSFLDTDAYATLIYNSGQAADVNPNVITSIIRQEQGTAGTSGSISGTVAGYEGYYNYFNIGAYTTSTMSAVVRGLWWAKGEGIGATTYGRPWDSRTKSITGGALYYKANYIDNNQNTFYLKKFNVLNGIDKVSTHQYMTHILAAASEGTSMGKAYAAYPDNASIFCIPVYSNMPTSAVSRPGTTGNNDNVLNSLRVIRAATEGQYTLTRSTGTTGFTRYTTDYTVRVPSTVTQIIVNGVAHNNVSYVSASSDYITLGAVDSTLPDGFQNKGTTTLSTLVTASTLYVRSGAGTSYDIIGSYKLGTTVTVLGTTTDLSGVPWYKVSYSGATGYISSTGTNKITTTKYFSDFLTGTTKLNLNVRKTPSATGTLLGTLSSGAKTVIYGYVLVPNTDGSVSKWYMTSYKGATVTGGDVITLKSGTNVISLTVTSTSGQKRVYTVTVNRY
jgi:uncharacterized protein YgiM (DUF1202 family)/beta-N-acetylglucosaminidase